MTLTKFAEQLLENKRAVLFDLDGTLVDSLYYWGDCYMALFEQFPDEYFDIVEFYYYTGGCSLLYQAQWLVNKYNLPMTPEQVRDFWPETFFERHLPSLKFYPGAIAFMQWLRSNNVPFAVCTAGDPRIYRFFEKSPVKPDLFLSCETYQKPKPDPFIYLEAMRYLNMAPHECLIFEDSAGGLTSAYNSGGQTIGVFIRGGARKYRQLCEQYITSWLELIQ